MADFKNNLILVTGGAGAIGSNLVKKLHQEGAKIIVIDDLSSGCKENIAGIPNVQLVKENITNNDALLKIFSQPINYVFHLAASFANQKSIESPLDDLDINVDGTLKLLQHSVKLKNLKRFIYASSSCVYGNVDGIIREETFLAPETPYAISKLAAEYYTLFFHKYYDLPIVILRYFNSYGPGEYPGKYRNVIPNFFKLAINGFPLTITGTGEEIRTFTFVKDIVEGTIKAALKEEAIGECFDIGSDKETKMKDLAEKINSLVKNKAGITFIEKRKWDSIFRRVSSCEKAKRIIDFQPGINLNDGLKQTREWFLSLKKRGRP